jgi:general secretion pathway protein E
MDTFTELSDFELDAATIRRLPRDFCQKHQVVLLGTWPTEPQAYLTLGMVDPTQAQARALVGRQLKRGVRAVRLNAYEVGKALIYGFDGAHASASAKGILLPVGAGQVRPDASAGELLDDLLGRAIRMEASDIHIESYTDDVDVRVRVDGVLRQTFTHLNPDNVSHVVSRIKVLSGLDITERRIPQDGRLRVRLEVRKGKVPVAIDLRVSTIPCMAGEEVVLRVLRTVSGVMEMEKLGIDAHRQTQIEALLSNPEGLLLVTGPTGSGKTSTLYAALDFIRDGTKKVLTAEDPIEIVLSKVNQKQVTPLAGMADLARAFLRQDPDIIMIGEVRDAETAETAIKGASTGHLVLSTLHTADAWGAVQRLRGLGIDSASIAEVLLGVISQRLIRRLCPACTQPGAPTDRDRAFFGAMLDGVYPRVAVGCAQCNQSGYRGRVGIFELLIVDDRLQDAIFTEQGGGDVRDELRARGFHSLVQDGLARVRDGTTSLAELVRVLPFRAIETERAAAAASGISIEGV